MNVSHEPLKSLLLAILGIFTVSVFVLFAYGVNTDHYLTYNLLYKDIFLYPEKYEETLLVIVLASPGIKYFTILLDPILTEPTLMIVSAVLLNSFLLFVGYQVVKAYVTPTIALFFVLVLGMLANGYFIGIDNTQISFDRKAVATLVLLASVAGLLRRKYWIGQLAATIALMLHTLDSFAVLCFFYPGFIFYTIRANRIDVPQMISSFAPVLAALLFTLYQQSQISLPGIPVETAEWMKFLFDVETTDVLFYPNLLPMGWFAVPLIGFAFWMSLAESKKTLLDLLCVSFVPIILVIVVLEIMHGYGLVFGFVSEYFTAVQLRRGLWFILVTCLLRLFQTMQGSLEQGHTRANTLFIVVLTGMLVHSWITIIIAGAGILWWRCQTKHDVGVVLVVVSFIGWSVLWFGGYGQYVVVSSELQKVIVFGVLVVIVLLGLQVFSLQKAILAMLVCYGIVMLANNNLLKGNTVFLDSHQRIYSSRTDPKNAAAEWMRVQADEKKLEELDLIEKLNVVTGEKDVGVLFLGMELGYAAPVIINKRLLFSRWDNSSMFSKRLYENYLYRLSDFGVSDIQCPQTAGEGIACVQEKIAEKIDSLELEDLRALMAKYRLNYVVRRKPLPIDEIHRTKRYFVYQIGA